MKGKDRVDMATVVAMVPKGKKSGVEVEGGPAIRAVPESLAWTVWDTPDRVAAHPGVRDGLGNAMPRLVLATFKNGALKISATRRPGMMLSDAARLARAMHTWVDSALVSEPEVKLGRIQQMVVKRLRLEGRRYIGGGVFESLDVKEALAVLAQIRPITEPPKAPREPEIPSFLRKENQMHNEMRNEETTHAANLPALMVANTAIRQDQEGRYCLNDLHKAAGGEKHHAPNEWMRNKQTTELIEELTKPENSGLEQNQPVSVLRGGASPGTYVCKELVYAYAMWISPKFHLTVIRAFDALVSGRKPEVMAAGVDPEITRAARMTAWRIANEMRIAYLSAMGEARRPEDEERAWEAFAIQMERIEERLLAKGREMGRKHGPQAVSAWIMSWVPEKPALV